MTNSGGSSIGCTGNGTSRGSENCTMALDRGGCGGDESRICEVTGEMPLSKVGP